MWLPWLLNNENEALWHLEKNVYSLLAVAHLALPCGLPNHGLFMWCMAEQAGSDCHLTPPRIALPHPSSSHLWEAKNTQLIIQNSAPATDIFFGSSCFLLFCIFLQMKKSGPRRKQPFISFVIFADALAILASMIFLLLFHISSTFLLLWKEHWWETKGLANHPMLAEPCNIGHVFNFSMLLLPKLGDLNIMIAMSLLVPKFKWLIIFTAQTRGDGRVKLSKWIAPSCHDDGIGLEPREPSVRKAICSGKGLWHINRRR